MQTDHVYAGSGQVAEVVGGSLYYVIPDGLGSTRLVKPSNGIAVFSTDYSPYGRGFGAIGSQTVRYVGQPCDSATGLSYFGARFYDPSIGRFISADSMMGTLSDPQSLNRYVYARDNPMTLSDPGGHDWWNNWNDIGVLR